ncbi:phenylalanine--tRNA ligase subunit beta [candidate division WOR-3 bacterium]|nr:phenylalanine--tRNA ligase subunit beta [candidate division WOR-3 bacterium]
MPKVVTEKQSLLSLAEKPISLEKIQELSWLAKAEMTISADTEEITLEFADTNRPDLWSPEGLMRLINQYLEGKARDYSYLSDPYDNEKYVIVEESVQRVRPYIGMFLCKMPPVTEKTLKSLIQTQEKLAENYGKKRKIVSIGLYPASIVDFPIIYKGVKPNEESFTPLGFEEEMTLAEILVKHPKGIEYRDILEARKCVPLMVDKKGEILSFPPIINSRRTGEVKIGDTYLAVEATGNDLSAVRLVLNIFAMNLSDRGGQITRMRSLYPDNQIYTFPTDETEEFYLNIPQVNNLLGSEFGIEKISSNLRKMGLKSKKGTFDKELIVTVPFYRRDIMHEVDIIEDIAIASDYNDFEPQMPESYTKGGLSPQQERVDTVRQISIGMGFLEYMGNILTSKETMKTCAGKHSDPIEIANPMTSMFSCLRDFLFPGLLTAESKNSKSLYPHHIFETGEIVRKVFGQEALKTDTVFSIAYLIAGPETNFSDIYSVIDTICEMLSVKLSLLEKDFDFFIPGRSACVYLNGVNSGFLGEVSPKLLDVLGIRMPLVLCEINDISFLFERKAN